MRQKYQMIVTTSNDGRRLEGERDDPATFIPPTPYPARIEPPCRVPCVYVGFHCAIQDINVLYDSKI